jgi:ATP-binding cassette subfamily C protein
MAQLRVIDANTLFTSITKSVRFALQSAMLGLGAYLAIKQQITLGVIIAGSILSARALAPVEQIVGQWKSLLAARQAKKRLYDALNDAEKNNPATLLPDPKQNISIQNFFCGYGAEPQIKGVSFHLVAGDALGIIGPSASGKTMLIKGLLNVAPCLRGSFRLDGAELNQYTLEARSRFIGYLPQEVRLFQGTIFENIARFRPNAKHEEVIQAAKIAQVHDMITGLEDGYDTMISATGMPLSGGQRQRIGLARAIFGTPFLVVLDEPNSSLDAVGDAALTEAIMYLRREKSIVIVISHRENAVEALSHILGMKQGQLVAFGPKEEVLSKMLASRVKQS